ncbi:hypothetical protein HMPREF1484_00210 [Dermabacter sp. HFH0086]|uniref:hypothetical protein n=1 Tax=Dermabacter TaxID=36739 RepID=UPI0003548946|nr:MULTISPECIES: hypothetical protein [Dermabacter]EPH17525.1 hypothetical protein HMPREF1484_00210 [Dermabacter sp. HFH0086]
MISINFNPQTNVLEIRHQGDPSHTETLNEALRHVLEALDGVGTLAGESQGQVLGCDEKIVCNPSTVTETIKDSSLDPATYAERLVKALKE